MLINKILKYKSKNLLMNKPSKIQLKLQFFFDLHG